jgi:hypothetical protein
LSIRFDFRRDVEIVTFWNLIKLTISEAVGLY